MRLIISVLFFCVCIIKLQAQENIIKTIAGTGVGGYGGDGGSAINAKLYYPEAVTFDKQGNLLIADVANNRIRKIDFSTGEMSSLAGIDTFGYSGDQGLATNAQLNFPEDVCIDTSGNIYFADAYNNRIRKITISTGIITTVAGNGVPGSSGDGGPATNAKLNEPSGLCIDKTGNIYIADYLNNKVRKVDILTGEIFTIAGTGMVGYSGNGGPATNAQFNGPVKIFIDSTDNIYISDQWNSVVRKISALSKNITTIAGNGNVGYSGDNGLAINAKLNQPGGLFLDINNNMYVAEYGNGVIRKLDGATGILSTVAGTGICGFSGDGGPATNAKLFPGGLVFDAAGIMYIADYQNMRIRKVYNTLAAPQTQNPKEIKVYPNPLRDEVTIEGAEGSEVMIRDVMGREVYRGIAVSKKETIDMSRYAVGVYVLDIVDKATMNRVVRKLVKE